MITDSRARRRSTARGGAESEGLAIGLVSQLARRIALEFGDELAPLGLTPAQFAVVDVLFSNGGSVTQADIARSVGVEQPTMAVTLRRMEGNNLVVRVADPSDGRQSLVSPTPLVKRKRSRLTAAHHGVESTMMTALGQDEQAEWKGLLRKLRDGFAADHRTTGVPGWRGRILSIPGR